MLELEDLSLFLMVAEQGSLTRAAIQLGSSQPTISKRIQLLEAEFGSRLLYRDGRGVRLTEAGTRFAEVAQSIRGQLDGLHQTLGDNGCALQGLVTLALPPSLGSSLSVSLARQFKARFPQARLRVIEAFSGSLLEMLEAGKVDIGILYDARNAPTMLVDPLFREQLYLIEHPTSSSDKASADIAELGVGPFVLPHASNGLRRVIETAAALHNIHVEVSVELDSLTALKRMVEGGPERSVLPFGAVYQEVRDGRLKARPFTDEGLSALLVCATPLHRPVRKLTEALRGLLVEEVQAGIANGTLTGCPTLLGKGCR